MFKLSSLNKLSWIVQCSDQIFLHFRTRSTPACQQRFVSDAFHNRFGTVCIAPFKVSCIIRLFKTNQPLCKGYISQQSHKQLFADDLESTKHENSGLRAHCFFFCNTIASTYKSIKPTDWYRRRSTITDCTQNSSVSHFLFWNVKASKKLRSVVVISSFSVPW